MTTAALSEALAKLRQIKVPNWPADRILGDIADEIESALASAEPVAGLSLRFGLGAWVVNTGAHDGEPCVFIDDAPKPGKVGERAEPVREGTTPRLRLLFPTDDQCVCVADALVNAPLSPSAASMRDLADMLDPEKQAAVLRAAADAKPAAKVGALSKRNAFPPDEFESWFNEIWAGTDNRPLPEWQKEGWNEYIAEHQLALGAWMAALDSSPAPAIVPDGLTWNNPAPHASAPLAPSPHATILAGPFAAKHNSEEPTP